MPFTNTFKARLHKKKANFFCLFMRKRHTACVEGLNARLLLYTVSVDLILPFLKKEDSYALVALLKHVVPVLLRTWV